MKKGIELMFCVFLAILWFMVSIVGFVTGDISVGICFGIETVIWVLITFLQIVFI